MNQNDTEWNVVVFISSLGLNGILVPTERETVEVKDAA
jgi:hypothetical protein